MKRRARLLKRERARVAHENMVVQEAERLLSPKPMRRKVDWYDAASSLIEGRDYLDLETHLISPRLCGVSTTYAIHDEVTYMSMSGAHVRRTCYATIASISEQESPLVPVVRIRSGGYGAAALLVPGLQDRIAHVEPKGAQGADVLFGRKFVEEAVRWASFDDVIHASDEHSRKSLERSTAVS
jgi:hypothetical protein